MSEPKPLYTAAQIAPDTQNARRYFSDADLSAVRSLSRAGEAARLENLLRWRELSDEIPHGARGTAEREYAAAMMISAGHLRKLMAAIAAYGEDYIHEKINAGVGLEHFQTAKNLAELAHKTPRQLLDEAVTLGNAHGETMTVEEMTAHAIGEHAPRPETFAAMGWLSRLAELPARLKWDAGKAAKLKDLIEQIKELMK